MNPEPGTKLTERLAVETVHGHDPINGRSVNPGLTVTPLGEKKLVVMAAPLGGQEIQRTHRPMMRIQTSR